jgi:hypothetical protein
MVKLEDENEKNAIGSFSSHSIILIPIEFRILLLANSLRLGDLAPVFIKLRLLFLARSLGLDDLVPLHHRALAPFSCDS